MKTLLIAIVSAFVFAACSSSSHGPCPAYKEKTANDNNLEQVVDVENALD
ncbi:MAG: hypothetical protein ACK4K0_04360 [Flavobacteriales bacterium]